MLHRSLLSKVTSSFQEFVFSSNYFNIKPQDDEEEAYFETIEMSSYLRSFKVLDSYQTLYEQLS